MSRADSASRPWSLGLGPSWGAEGPFRIQAEMPATTHERSQKEASIKPESLFLALFWLV